jgi:hypothetical protein
MKKQSKRAQVKKLRLHRETLERLDLRPEDWRQVAGGSVTVPDSFCPISARPPIQTTC